MPYVIVNGVVYASNGNGLVFALRANDGSQLWQHANMSSQTLIVQNGQVHLFLGDSIAALSAGNGSLLWQHSVTHVVGGESWVQPEVVADGIVYTEAENGTVQAFQASDGASLWHYTIPEIAVPPIDPIIFSRYQLYGFNFLHAGAASCDRSGTPDIYSLPGRMETAK